MKPASYAAAVAQYTPLVMKLTVRYARRPDGEDIRQAAWLGLFRAVDTFRDEAGASFLGWAALHIRGAVSRAIGHTRRAGFGGRKAHTVAALSFDCPLDEDGSTMHDLLGSDACQEDRAEDAERRAIVLRAVGELDGRDRAIVQACIEGESHTRIGERVGLSHEGVRQIVTKFIARTRKRAA